MAKFQAFQVTVLPGVLEPNAIYYVEAANGTDAEAFITDVSGVLHNIGNTNMITGVVNPLITAAIAAQSQVEVYADIATRDADTLTENTLVIVKDASGDPTVTSGAALYIYESVPDTFDKLSEFESLDLVLDWSSIQNKPTSAVADIDDAVTKRHTHANKTELDRLGINGTDDLTIDGVAAQVSWVTANW